MTAPEVPRPPSTVPVEAREHQGRPAGIVSRLAAAVLDLLVVAGVMVGAYVGWSALRFVLWSTSSALPRPSLLLVTGTYLVVAVSCLGFPWAVTGRSYGQHVMGLRVVAREGRNAPLPRALLRAVVCVCFPLGLLWSGLDRRHAAVHDLLLGTSVQYDWRTWH
jgi:uncharacterized RDD family membrane protein YckC